MFELIQILELLLWPVLVSSNTHSVEQVEK